MRALPPHLSGDCVSFIREMLESDPEARPSAAELLQHPFIARHARGGCGGAGQKLAPIADATAYITSSRWGSGDGGKRVGAPSMPGLNSSFGAGANKPSGWRNVRPASVQAPDSFRLPLQPAVTGAPLPHQPAGPPSPPRKQGSYKSSESEWAPQPHPHRDSRLHQRDSPQHHGFGLAARGGATAAPPSTPQPPPRPSQRLSSHNSFGSVSFYNAEAETPAHAAVAGELIRARHWEVLALRLPHLIFLICGMQSYKGQGDPKPSLCRIRQPEMGTVAWRDCSHLRCSEPTAGLGCTRCFLEFNSLGGVAQWRGSGVDEVSLVSAARWRIAGRCRLFDARPA
jgi:hypothetical protein